MEFKNISWCAASTTERDHLILNHLKICKAIALQIQKNLPAQVELDDLIHAGVLGLMDAAAKYDPSKQVEFANYARHRIRGAILDSLRELDFASRNLRRQWKHVEAVADELSKMLQRDPTEDEIAERLKVGIAELRKIRFDAQSLTHVSTRYISPEDDTVVEHDFPSRPETRPDHMFSRVQMKAAIDKAMKPLPPRQLQLMVAYYSGQKTMKEIACSMGINQSRVSQLHKSGLATMQTELLASGVHSGGAF